ncbi:MAG TPA: lipoprotein [Roseiarcus sp.]|nr:lipoprotein [Roseiarcus sp.]
MAAQFPQSFSTRFSALAIAFALGLSGCGRYGPLEPPGSAAPKPANTNPTSMSALSHPSIPPIVPPKQPFFLDPLLK